MGDRLAFNNGILALSIVAGLVFFAFNGNTSSLIPLYAVGVFLAFTLSQAGMVVHWWRLRSGGWRRSILFNGIGCVLTAIVFVIAAVTKFTAGAWVSLLIVVVFTAVALLTRRHFDRVAAATGLSPEASASEQNEETPSQFSNLAIVPVPYLNRVTVRALAYAVSLGQPVLALHVSPTEEEAKRFREYWADWGNHVPLEVVKSPYRAVIPPTVAYIEALHAQRPELTLTVIVPELALRHWWQRRLYEDTATRLRRSLAELPMVLVTRVRSTSDERSRKLSDDGSPAWTGRCQSMTHSVWRRSHDEKRRLHAAVGIDHVRSSASHRVGDSVARHVDLGRSRRHPGRLPQPRSSARGESRWIFVIVLIPLLGVMIYVIARGDKMSEHEIGGERWLEDLRDRGVLTDEEFKRASDRLARRTSASRADDVAALEDLRDHGVLTDEEFQRANDKAAA